MSFLVAENNALQQPLLSDEAGDNLANFVPGEALVTNFVKNTLPFGFTNQNPGANENVPLSNPFDLLHIIEPDGLECMQICTVEGDQGARVDYPGGAELQQVSSEMRGIKFALGEDSMSPSENLQGTFHLDSATGMLPASGIILSNKSLDYRGQGIVYNSGNDMNPHGPSDNCDSVEKSRTVVVGCVTVDKSLKGDVFVIKETTEQLQGAVHPVVTTGTSPTVAGTVFLEDEMELVDKGGTFLVPGEAAMLKEIGVDMNSLAQTEIVLDCQKHITQEAMLINARWEFKKAQDNLRLQENKLIPNVKPKSLKPSIKNSKKGFVVASVGRHTRQNPL